ncbi:MULTISPECIES: type 2 periplasmic-binding domain-containing protein [Pseudomonas]|uniref:hypothetical protein n=1 Tax=Pseudomonas TaxID=286 RepID=UPI003531B76D
MVHRDKELYPTVPLLRTVDIEPLVAEQVTSLDLMMALVSAGFALGLAGASQIVANREPGIVPRSLDGRSPMLTTYLLQPAGESSQTLALFIERDDVTDALQDGGSVALSKPDTTEEIEP